ncbi:DUF6599 family protein [candidate division CSSED10-310 bacterium]|uniref:DUF6599 family protein n=1 Tax=candidate division CSSED10-310 bacterium TaxID=2855610 RepID=A0ABV6Z3Q0_UNCC1
MSDHDLKHFSQTVRSGFWVLFFCTISVLFFTCSSVEGGIALDDILPREWDGWALSAQDRQFDPENLFDFINGGAELYLSFGFEKLFVRSYHKKDNPRLEVNLFEMGNAANAFGIFRNDLEDDEAGVGAGSEYGAGWLRFWKGSKFVYIYADQEMAGLKQILVFLGKQIAAKIQEDSPKPELLNFIPGSGLKEKSLRFFHQYQNLNYNYYLSEKNILHLSQKTEAILTRYHQDKNLASLLLIKYQSVQEAQQAYTSFITVYLPEAKKGNLVKTEDGQWNSVTRHTQFLVIILEASTASFNEHLRDAVLLKLKGGINEP